MKLKKYFLNIKNRSFLLRGVRFWIIIVFFSWFVVILIFLKHTSGINNAKEEIQKTRSSSEIQSDGKILDIEEVLKSTGVVKKKIGASKYDICAVSPNYAGWFVNNWSQECFLKYVAGFSTNLDKASAVERISAEPELLKSLNNIRKNKSNHECVIFSSNNNGTTVFYRPSGSPIHLPSTDCYIPSQIRDDSIYHGKKYVETPYNFFVETEVDNSTNQIWIEYHQYYFTKNIGCGIEIFFCSIQPLGYPVQALDNSGSGPKYFELMKTALNTILK